MIFLLFIFAFVYRIVLMLWPTFPSGADIGLHNSVISSITHSGNTNFLYNFYQMGGGLSLTFPGYHIFASEIIAITGLSSSSYIAQAFIVALFSSFIVLAAYLVTRAAWTESGALIVAFLVAISRFDIEMLMWGGYPNVITLFLIPLTFYLYLQKNRFSSVPFLISTSILAGSIFLTHSLSAVIFVAVTVTTVLFVMVRPSSFSASRKQILFWLLPIVFGAILVSPFLSQAAHAYFTSNATLNTALDIQSAILSMKIVPLEIIVPLFAILCLFFFLSKEYRGRYFSLPAFLFFIWLLVPLILTQGYLFGLIIDYNRFLYFLLLPVLVLFGMFLNHGSLFLARIIDTYRSLTSQLPKTTQNTNKYVIGISQCLSRRKLYIIFVGAILVGSLFLVPLFVTPSQGLAVGSFYQVMDNSGYQGIQWAKDNTPIGSIFISDALYGWWLGGFSQRPTISAVDPQYLTGINELNPAKNASLLLDTDFMIDNGFIQVREDGGYLARHNPEILTKLNWTYFPYSFFNFNSNQTKIEYYSNGVKQNSFSLNELAVKKMQIAIGDNNSSATIIVSRGNDFFNCTQFTTVYRGLPFVNMTTVLDTTAKGITFDDISFTIECKGTKIDLSNNVLSLVDQGVKAFGQLSFGGQAEIQELPSLSPYLINVNYELQTKNQGQLQILASTYSETNAEQYYQSLSTIQEYFRHIIISNVNTLLQPVGNTTITTFDYKATIQYYNISYIATRVSDLNPKFTGDPNFSLVFINDKVAIFKVEANANQVGR